MSILGLQYASLDMEVTIHKRREIRDQEGLNVECHTKRTSANIIISDKGRPMIKKQHYPGDIRHIWFKIRRPSRSHLQLFEFRPRSEVIGSENALPPPPRFQWVGVPTITYTIDQQVFGWR